MAHTVLLHSALGRTAGIDRIAEGLRANGHEVFAPDFYGGHTFTTAEEGVGHSRTIGFSALVDRVKEACRGLDGPLVFAGLSLGASIAQQMGKNDDRARGVLLLHGGGFPSRTRWQPQVPVQVHFSVDDVWREPSQVENLLASAAGVGAGAESCLYPGGSHLFSDPESDDHDPKSAALLWTRAERFLASTDAG
ncbi:dienelactone hydrolase family protein [Brevibacterium casei]|uniref:Dienelactone hydrolase n=2 Tax=Bacteria TaxID=2 RepID=K9AVN5_9MICO|nr:dienelactone hydrolase family protein [Brevibacterium casei]EKU46647.1 dienelactone hydrolase [Brevibacterium casei S18]MBE4695087.1 dienelactone hydrolase [Brevibacterium casei]MBY3578209.1 dienelactone hydrolase [Brevibacterium casei]MCT1445897.1 dienelactone hydrolase family protein [Brevibacterium casei]MCT2357785.1 dienelactone hydrolase family protein [Brevibacterium casei]